METGKKLGKADLHGTQLPATACLGLAGGLWFYLLPPSNQNWTRIFKLLISLKSIEFSDFWHFCRRPIHAFTVFKISFATSLIQAGKPVHITAVKMPLPVVILAAFYSGLNDRRGT